LSPWRSEAAGDRPDATGASNGGRPVWLLRSTDFASFEAWCNRQGLPSSPATPAAVAVYLAALADAGRKASTIERALAGIAWAQRARGFEWQKAHPAISAVMTGIRRTHGTAPTQKAPVV
jgi:hypothetical protein